MPLLNLVATIHRASSGSTRVVGINLSELSDERIDRRVEELAKLLGIAE